MSTDSLESVPSLADIRSAHARIMSHIHRTPVLTCQSLDDITSGQLFFKCENFQKVGAFKVRGAMNAVLSLDKKQASRGVVTESSGNHAAGLAFAARVRGIPCYVVMPDTAPEVKKEAVTAYGAELTFCPPARAEYDKHTNEIINRTGATFIHPFNDYSIIAGQATAAVELIEQVPDLDIVITPIGGGGLTSGTALAVKYLSPQTTMVAAEPEGADDAFRSLQARKLIPLTGYDTIADGLLSSLGDKTFPILRDCVDSVITASEKAIVHSMRKCWERMKIVVEPSAAVPLAALLEDKLDVTGKRVGIIISGGNAEFGQIPKLRVE